MNHRLGWILFVATAASVGLLADADHEIKSVVAQSAVEGCPETSAPELHAGATLQTFAETSNSGVVFDGTSSSLKLAKEGGRFSAATVGISDSHNASCAADFDGDGWTDLIVGQSHDKFIYFYKNETYLEPEPNWDDPNDIRTPRFTPRHTVHYPVNSGLGHAGLTCGDFNNDGKMDFFYYKSQDGPYNYIPDSYQRLYLGNGDGTFGSPVQDGTKWRDSYTEFAVDRADLGHYAQTSTNAVSLDYNNDGWVDVLFGTTSGGNGEDGKGRVVAMINNCPDLYTPGTACSVTPQFSGTVIIDNQSFGDLGMNALLFDDFTGDGIKDILANSPSLCGDWKLYPGVSGGGFDAPQSAPSVGGASAAVAADFNLDGKIDFAWGRDGYNCSSHGGKAFVHMNNGTGQPFSGGPTQQLTEYNTAVGTTGVVLRDYDLGSVLDYDQDPDGTLDFILADGNNSGSYLLFANRVVANYVECGTIQSGVLELGVLEDQEMVVTAARLNPSISPALPYTPPMDIKFYMSNEEPANWQLADECSDNNAEFCVSFPKPVGREVRWKAELCSSEDKTQSPSISGMSISFDYTEAKEHYRAGVVVDDGVAYVGAFRQPGNRGHFYAVSADLGETYWDFASKLDGMADSARNMYTSDVAGTTRLDFTVANAEDLKATLNVASTANAASVISWQRSARFGVGGGSRLGSIENSTPAVVGKPGLPIWYPRADQATRVKVDAFIAAQKDRPKLVLVGAKDGAVHAVRTLPTNISDPINGTEAWAYIPAKVAYGFVEDMTKDRAAAFPDGSPTVADVIMDDGELHTIAIISGGNGNKSMTALDITETINSSGTVVGPTPLWHVVPGGTKAGMAMSKPVIGRVLVAGNPHFYAIMATGIDRDHPDDPELGRDVVAVDISTGNIVWQFQSKCTVTSDIVIFETDDVLEDDAPAVDGYIDRAVWADSCGYVYKVNPAQNVGNGFISGYGSIATGHVDPDAQAVGAIFSTEFSTCAIGEDRPIVGTIGARSDTTGRFALFFGTGGIESYPINKRNDFYSIYADTGEIRGCAAGTPEKGRVQGTCTAGVCEKFYGGVVVSASDIIVTRATDAPVGTGTCEFGSSEIAGFSISEFDETFSVPTNSATVSSLYGDGGAIYFATLAGEIVKIGTPKAATAGEDSAGGDGEGQAGGDPDDDGTGSGMSLLGWRMVQ